MNLINIIKLFTQTQKAQNFPSQQSDFEAILNDFQTVFENIDKDLFQLLKFLFDNGKISKEELEKIFSILEKGDKKKRVDEDSGWGTKLETGEEKLTQLLEIISILNGLNGGGDKASKVIDKASKVISEDEKIDVSELSKKVEMFFINEEKNIIRDINAKDDEVQNQKELKSIQNIDQKELKNSDEIKTGKDVGKEENIADDLKVNILIKDKSGMKKDFIDESKDKNKDKHIEKIEKNYSGELLRNEDDLSEVKIDEGVKDKIIVEKGKSDNEVNGKKIDSSGKSNGKSENIDSESFGVEELDLKASKNEGNKTQGMGGEIEGIERKMGENGNDKVSFNKVNKVEFGKVEGNKLSGDNFNVKDDFKVDNNFSGAEVRGVGDSVDSKKGISVDSEKGVSKGVVDLNNGRFQDIRLNTDVKVGDVRSDFMKVDDIKNIVLDLARISHDGRRASVEVNVMGSKVNIEVVSFEKSVMVNISTSDKQLANNLSRDYDNLRNFLASAGFSLLSLNVSTSTYNDSYKSPYHYRHLSGHLLGEVVEGSKDTSFWKLSIFA